MTTHFDIEIGPYATACWRTRPGHWVAEIRIDRMVTLTATGGNPLESLVAARRYLRDLLGAEADDLPVRFVLPEAHCSAAAQ